MNREDHIGLPATCHASAARRGHSPVIAVGALVKAMQPDRIELAQMRTAMRSIPPEQRQALRLTVCLVHASNYRSK